MKRTDIINNFIQKLGYENYLEIGTQNPNGNFNHVNVKNKVSVEPFPVTGLTVNDYSFVGTSNEYFESITDDVKFDIVFIDGLHQYDQVLIDIQNSLNHLSDNGTIVCHDCLPYTEKMQEREDPGGEWTGDTWKAIAELRVETIDLDIKVVDTDYGCGIIRRGTNIPYITDKNYKTYTFFNSNKQELMNVISKENFITWINSL